jgi:hypothetical protein
MREYGHRNTRAVISMTPYITLNPTERRLAQFIAKGRYERSRKRGIEDRKQGDQSNEMTDLEGMAAEIAFCRYMNLFPALDIGRYEDWDCILPDGRKVDVKTTVYPSGRLLAVTWKKPKQIDLFALMVGAFPVYRCAGYMTAKDLLSDEHLTDLGHGPVYAASQAELLNIEDLKNGFEKSR